MLIPQMEGESPSAQVIIAKVVKASLLKICVHRLSLPKGRVQELSLGHGEDKGFYIYSLVLIPPGKHMTTTTVVSSI